MSPGPPRARYDPPVSGPPPPKSRNVQQAIHPSLRGISPFPQVQREVYSPRGRPEENSPKPPLPGPPPVQPSEKELAQEAAKRGVHEAILFLLTANGFRETADSLRREALLSGDGKRPKGRLGGFLPAAVEALKGRFEAAVKKEDGEHQRLELLTEEMSGQRRRLTAMRELVHRMREMVDIPEQDPKELALVAQARAKLRDELERGEEEVADLRRTLAAHDADEKRLARELRAAEDEVKKLRRATAIASDGSGVAKSYFDTFDEDGDGLISPEEFEKGLKTLMVEAQKIRGLLASWDLPGSPAQSIIENAFKDVDANNDGKLEWNNNEIKSFVLRVFARASLSVPPWEDAVWWELYRSADVDNSISLDLAESSNFAQHVFQVTLATILRSPAAAKMFSEHPASAAETWARSHVHVPMAITTVVYRGLTVNCQELSSQMSVVQTANVRHRPRMIRIIEAGDHVRTSLQVYHSCDKDSSGLLEWHNGEIREFIAKTFQRLDLVPPPEEQMYRMFKTFDRDRNNALDALECVEMVDALMRSCFITEHPRRPHSVGSASSGSVKASSGPCSSFLAMPPMARAASRVASPTMYQVPARARSASLMITSPGSPNQGSPRSIGTLSASLGSMSSMRENLMTRNSQSQRRPNGFPAPSPTGSFVGGPPVARYNTSPPSSPPPPTVAFAGWGTSSMDRNTLGHAPRSERKEDAPTPFWKPGG